MAQNLRCPKGMVFATKKARFRTPSKRLYACGLSPSHERLSSGFTFQTMRLSPLHQLTQDSLDDAALASCLSSVMASSEPETLQDKDRSQRVFPMHLVEQTSVVSPLGCSWIFGICFWIILGHVEEEEIPSAETNAHTSPSPVGIPSCFSFGSCSPAPSNLCKVVTTSSPPDTPEPAPKDPFFYKQNNVCMWPRVFGTRKASSAIVTRDPYRCYIYIHVHPPPKEDAASQPPSAKKTITACADPNKAAEQAIRRMLKPNRHGSKKLSEEVCRKFLDGGEGRQELIRMYIEANGRKDPSI